MEIYSLHQIYNIFPFATIVSYIVTIDYVDDTLTVISSYGAFSEIRPHFMNVILFVHIDKTSFTLHIISIVR